MLGPGWGLGLGLGLQPNNLLLITVDNYNTILLITQGTAVKIQRSLCVS